MKISEKQLYRLCCIAFSISGIPENYILSEGYKKDIDLLIKEIIDQQSNELMEINL